jgi:hypothetical protein
MEMTAPKDSTKHWVIVDLSFHPSKVMLLICWYLLFLMLEHPLL